MTCKDVQNQLRYQFDGEQLHSLLPEVQEHLAHCIHCRQKYETLREIDASLKNVQPDVPVEILNSIEISDVPANHRLLDGIRRWAAVLALVLVIILGATAVTRWLLHSPELSETPEFALDYVEAPASHNTVVVFQKKQERRTYYIIWIF